jgi:hypothetical protein
LNTHIGKAAAVRGKNNESETKTTFADTNEIKISEDEDNPFIANFFRDFQRESTLYDICKDNTRNDNIFSYLTKKKDAGNFNSLNIDCKYKKHHCSLR